MNASLTTARRLIATTIGASAIAVAALAVSAPANAETFQHSCETSPASYVPVAVLGVYSTQRRGIDRNELCDLYDASHEHLGTYTKQDYGYYRLGAPIMPPLLLSDR